MVLWYEDWRDRATARAIIVASNSLFVRVHKKLILGWWDFRFLFYKALNEIDNIYFIVSMAIWNCHLIIFEVSNLMALVL